VLENVRKVFTDPDGPTGGHAVDGVSLEVRRETRHVSRPVRLRQATALRIIAGFENPTSGRVLIGGRCDPPAASPPHTAMVFRAMQSSRPLVAQNWPWPEMAVCRKARSRQGSAHPRVVSSPVWSTAHRSNFGRPAATRRLLAPSSPSRGSSSSTNVSNLDAKLRSRCR